jgi:hypothetical protein
MDVLISDALCHDEWLCLGRIAIAVMLVLTPGIVWGSAQEGPSTIAVKAAFLFNFAKFAEWPALRSDAPIFVCVVGDEEVAAALVETARGQSVGGRAIDVLSPSDSATWRGCQLLFIADAEPRRAADRVGPLKTVPVLTVSDSKGFSEAGGIIELFVEAGRMRFAINVDAADRAGVRLSSRLLGLAKVIRTPHVQ